MKEGSKYQPLLDYLRENNASEVTLTFAEIEVLMKNQLPGSARSKQTWCFGVEVLSPTISTAPSPYSGDVKLLKYIETHPDSK